MNVSSDQALQEKSGGGDHGLAVAQAMYLSQCATTTRMHLTHLLEMLSPEAKGKEAASEGLVKELTGKAVQCRAVLFAMMYVVQVS